MENSSSPRVKAYPTNDAPKSILTSELILDRANVISSRLSDLINRSETFKERLSGSYPREGDSRIGDKTPVPMKATDFQFRILGELDSIENKLSHLENVTRYISEF